MKQSQGSCQFQDKTGQKKTKQTRYSLHHIHNNNRNIQMIKSYTTELEKLVVDISIAKVKFVKNMSTC